MAHNQFTDRLEKLREHLGIATVQEFVDRLSEGARKPIPYATARRYHNDNREPPVTYMVEVAKVFDVSLRWLLLNEGPLRETSRQVRSELSEIEDRQITDTILKKLGRPAEPPIIVEGQSVQVDRPLPPVASWAGPVRELCSRFWDIEATAASDADKPLPEFEKTSAKIGAALAAPLRELELEWDDMSEQERDDYVLGTVVVLSNAIGPRP